MTRCAAESADLAEKRSAGLAHRPPSKVEASPGLYNRVAFETAKRQSRCSEPAFLHSELEAAPDDQE